MPRLSEFYGIVIYMYWKDHAPPHFHAIYSGEEALIRIEDGDFIEGHLPRTARKLVLEFGASSTSTSCAPTGSSRSGR